MYALNECAIVHYNHGFCVPVLCTYFCGCNKDVQNKIYNIYIIHNSVFPLKATYTCHISQRQETRRHHTTTTICPITGTNYWYVTGYISVLVWRIHNLLRMHNLLRIHNTIFGLAKQKSDTLKHVHMIKFRRRPFFTSLLIQGIKWTL